MKKFLVSLMAVALFMSLSAISFAQQNQSPAVGKAVKSNIETLTGKIISIDKAKSEVTIQEKSGVEKTFSASAKQIAKLKTNESIEVTFKAGSNTAGKIRVIKKK